MALRVSPLRLGSLTGCAAASTVGVLAGLDVMLGVWNGVDEGAGALDAGAAAGCEGAAQAVATTPVAAARITRRAGPLRGCRSFM
jgi:hypothetical protein